MNVKECASEGAMNNFGKIRKDKDPSSMPKRPGSKKGPASKKMGKY